MAKENKKITKLSDLNQIDAKMEIEDKNGNFTPTTLDELLGTRFNKYGGVTLSEYEAEINSKNAAELQSHAINLGLVPNRDRTRLVKQLIAAFNKYSNSFQKPKHLDSNVRLAESKAGRKNLDTALKIMSAVK